ncbi:MAG: large subunit ribosomal protein L4 [Candidatus Berkelbacteria bacterium Licking1014_2]|uniref:Large ribosomal subunit protein uL4 n=1 Tax=Candidatus Berkelbacteria bacterium Licking1014_2 TaxID=2017146 RepID=A0A554LWX4_9BACT|nr:MAG: large subunit ribosomal protein L4 [Candidatus Berkelbacteria bacterium Licking1014_2]
MKAINYPVYNLKGEEVKKISLEPTVFAVSCHPHLTYQVTQTFLSNRRQVIAKTKTRGEVAKSGRKPWKQKGTGRARAGTFSSPIWRGGGTAFGPTNERNFKKRLPQKMKILATKAVLSDLVKEKKMVVVEKITISEPKTKKLIAILSRLPLKEKKITIVLESPETEIILSSRNIPNLNLKNAKNINFLDLATAGNLLIDEAAIAALTKRFHP